MGARNVARAYALGAGLSDRSMRVLAYMALRSVDGDPEPWFRMGHEALAVEALGRDPAGDDDKAREANKKAVRRAISPLLAAKIVVTVEGGARHRDGQPTTAKYRLDLGSRGDAKRPPLTAQQGTPNGANRGRLPAGNGLNRGRQTSPRGVPKAGVPKEHKDASARERARTEARTNIQDRADVSEEDAEQIMTALEAKQRARGDPVRDWPAFAAALPRARLRAELADDGDWNDRQQTVPAYEDF
jgi:hypothetical protein